MKPNIAPIAFAATMILTAGACGKQPPAGVTVTRVSFNKWSIRVERKYKGNPAFGRVVVRIPPPRGPIPHVNFAGARAWLSLAESRREAKDYDGAVACLQAGLKELGWDYAAGLPVIEDTGLHVYLAEYKMEKGHREEAARILIVVLLSRLSMYLESRADRIAE